MTAAAAPATAPATAPIRILYFAWLRERIGAAEESLTLPEGVASVGALIDLLRAGDDRHRAAFAHAELVRCAVNQAFATRGAAIAPGDEVAFFPPVTGG